MRPWVSKIARFLPEIQTHSLPVMPTIALRGSINRSPQLSVFSQLLDGAPAVAQAPHLCLHSAWPCIFGSVLNRFLKKKRGVSSFEELIIS